MKNNPLAIICIFFCLGIWTAQYVHIPLFFLYVSCVLFLFSALVSLRRQLLFSLSLGLAVFLAGFLHLTNAQTYSANHISNFVSNNPQKVYVMGEVVSNPEVSSTYYGSQKTVFTFRTRDLKMQDKWQTAEGLVKVTLYGERRVTYGDELLLQGSLTRPPGLRNPGGFDYQKYLANHNVFGLLKVKEKDAFLHFSQRDWKAPPIPSQGLSQYPVDSRGFPTPASSKLLKATFKFKQRLHNIIYTYLEPEQAALLSAILLGERSELSQDIKDLFIHTGTIHILATQYTKKPNNRASHNLTL